MYLNSGVRQDDVLSLMLFESGGDHSRHRCLRQNIFLFNTCKVKLKTENKS